MYLYNFAVETRMINMFVPTSSSLCLQPQVLTSRMHCPSVHLAFSSFRQCAWRRHTQWWVCASVFAAGQLVSWPWLRGCALMWALLLPCPILQLKREVCLQVTVCVFLRVAGLQPRGRPGSSAGFTDCSRPGPPSGLPLQEPAVSVASSSFFSVSFYSLPSQNPLLQCTMPSVHIVNFCCTTARNSSRIFAFPFVYFCLDLIAHVKVQKEVKWQTPNVDCLRSPRQ